MNEPLIFHVIYTPGTVTWLLGCSLSLLAASEQSQRPVRLRLVANGCDARELDLLSLFCTWQPRCDLYVLSRDRVLQHGMALNMLVQNSRETYFCMSDSDILASCDFTLPLEESIHAAAGVFSGAPSWCAPEELVVNLSFFQMPGRQMFTPQGRFIGCTYFAILNRTILLEAMQQTGLDLRSYAIDYDIPPAVLQSVRQQGLNHVWFDTTRLLFLNYAKRNWDLRYLDISGLHHFGGFAQDVEQAGQIDLAAAYVKKVGWLGRPFRNAGGQLVSRAKEESWLSDWNHWLQVLKPRRGACAQYFRALISGLWQGSALPVLPAGLPPVVNNQVRAAADAVCQAYPPYLDWLRSQKVDL